MSITGENVRRATLVCADNAEEAVQIAKMGPNVVLVEAPNSIEAGKRVTDDRVEINRVNQMVSAANPNIRVLHGGGISTADDVYNIVKWGAEGTGSTSGVLLAEGPLKNRRK